ncbi:short-chain fatty acyl-CoA regulator family protein [Pararhodobacter oceanensis]|uniref:XRE family transcriptional regulator n=1 Tax=Pararhodobacter oceanensis TaxID=2172121 RepID=A0A2T8HT81_9RHOB|nr:short-chain fatty acyl-CoA regulator family protein [Pararhodobacter oceanensis]PVH28603.1 XRE family transcriptional regulator [Pararhodobacter oceanensis]
MEKSALSGSLSGRLSGTRIRALRMSRRLGQGDLARMAGISPSYLNLIEHNRRRATPRLLEAVAQALQIPADLLDEGAGDVQIQALRAAASRASPITGAASAPEVERSEEFLGRFPGWAALVTQLSARSEDQNRIIERLSDRMAHDPNLSAALHEIVSAVTSVQSTAAILAETDDLEPEWRARFHHNIHADSIRLANASDALVAFLDTSGEEAGLAAPQEEFESWLARRGFHIAELETVETSATPDYTALIEGQAELASGPARDLARAWLARARDDALALPLDRLVPPLTAMFERGEGFAPDTLARDLDVPLPLLFHRLATLPAIKGVPRFGLVECDGSGTLTFRRPIEGFALPRFGGGCPRWPLYQALAQPHRPLSATLEVATRPPARFAAHAIATARDAHRFAPPYVWQSAMLITPVSAALPRHRRPEDIPEADLVAVGSSCRICPRAACDARREPSIVSA